VKGGAGSGERGAGSGECGAWRVEREARNEKRGEWRVKREARDVRREMRDEMRESRDDTRDARGDNRYAIRDTRVRVVRRPSSVVVSIDELILEGFAASEKYRIGEAVQRELERLFGETTRGNELISSGAREVVDAGAFQMQSARGDVIGSQIAQAVFEGLQTEK